MNLKPKIWHRILHNTALSLMLHNPFAITDLNNDQRLDLLIELPGKILPRYALVSSQKGYLFGEEIVTPNSVYYIHESLNNTTLISQDGNQITIPK